jgi:hypothetical protein
VVFAWPSLSLEIASDSHYELLAGVVSPLIAVAVAGHHGNMARLTLLPLLATLGAFLDAFNDGLGGCGPTTVGSRYHIV